MPRDFRDTTLGWGMSQKSRGSGEELRERFVDAARELLREPDTDLDLRKVAERAGKSRTAPYLAFGRTEEGGGLAGLRLAVASEGFRELGNRMDRALRSSRHSEEGLRGMAAAYLAFAGEEPRLFRLMFGPEVADALSDRVPEGPGRVERERLNRERVRTEFIFLEAIGMEEDGYLRQQGALRAEDLAGAVWAILHGVAMLTIDGQWGATSLGVLDDPEALAATTLRFLTTATSEEMAPARRALDEAIRQKESGDRPDVPMADVPLADAEEPEFRDADLRVAEAHPMLMPEESLASSAPRMSAGPFESRGSGSPVTDSPAPAPDSPALRRARAHAHLMDGARILWIDDTPEWVASEAEVFTALGAEVVMAESTDEALDHLRRDPFDLVLSDISRGGRDDEGIRALPQVSQAAGGAPVIFYVARVREDRPAPAGSFGIAGHPEELVHLVFDVLERRG
ncbi:MAG: response regulator [Gemmatimonadales bacterium]|nr:MAG: response regulator [Gemmatimonadales bacterium]